MDTTTDHFIPLALRVRGNNTNTNINTKNTICFFPSSSLHAGLEVFDITPLLDHVRVRDGGGKNISMDVGRGVTPPAELP